MSKRTIALILCGIMLLAVLSSCKPAKQEATVQVKIIGHEDTVIYDGEVKAVSTISDDGVPVVADVLLALEVLNEIDNLDMSDDYIEIRQIGEYKNQPDNQNTGAYFWNYSINGESVTDTNSSLKNAAVDTVKDGDELVFTYEWMKYADESK